MNRTRAQLFDEVYKELSRQKKEESWPDHIAAQAGKVNATAGELMRAGLNLKYHKSNTEEANKDLEAEVRRLAIVHAATSLRFLENL